VDAKEMEARPSPPGRRRRVIRLLLIIPATYVAVCLFVYLFQARMIYFPSRKLDLAPSDLGLAYQDVTLKTSDGLALGAWYVPAADAIGSALFCHGNAGNVSDLLPDIQLLHRMGLNVLVVDYRGFGRSEGRPGEVGTYLDAEAAWQHLTSERGEPAQRIVVMGRSLGGAVAIEVASRHAPAALMVESTFTQLADVGRVHYPLLPVGLLCRHRYASVARVGGITCPKLFLHGSEDSLIPISLGRALYDAAAAPREFIETPGDHGTAGFSFSDQTVRQAEAFIRKALAAGSDVP